MALTEATFAGSASKAPIQVVDLRELDSLFSLQQ